jgi:hypothetical protein
MILTNAKNIINATNMAWYKMMEAGAVETGCMDGGCLIFAKAFLRIADDLTSTASYSNKYAKGKLVSLKSEDGVVQHFCVRIDTHSKTIFVDSDGVHSEAQMIEKMLKLENVVITHMSVASVLDIAKTEAYKDEYLENLLYTLVDLNLNDGLDLGDIKLEQNKDSWALSYEKTIRVMKDLNPITLAL